jgi:hypothetical protein
MRLNFSREERGEDAIPAGHGKDAGWLARRRVIR